jgi:hypothetical protein
MWQHTTPNIHRLPTTTMQSRCGLVVAVGSRQGRAPTQGTNSLHPRATDLASSLLYLHINPTAPPPQGLYRQFKSPSLSEKERQQVVWELVSLERPHAARAACAACPACCQPTETNLLDFDSPSDSGAVHSPVCRGGGPAAGDGRGGEGEVGVGGRWGMRGGGGRRGG